VKEPAVVAAAPMVDTPVEVTAPRGVHGTVRAGDGRGVAQAAVTLISLGGSQLGRSVTRPDGSYRLDAPEAGSYVLIAAADGHQPQASTVTVGDEWLAHDLLLAGTSGLAGVVRGASDERPVGEAMVVVTDIRGEVLATAKTGDDGTFTFQELAAGIGGSSDGTATGQCTVAVNAPGFRPVARPVEIGTHGLTRLEIVLQPGARVQGTVRAGDGRRPLADARVTRIDAAGNVVATSTTGEDGAYAFTDLDAGEYTVMASGYPPVANALTVNGSGVDGYDVELRHPDE
jgi:uncharacterized protein YfaS (alpha-2-macroglobulin family)